MNVKNTEHYQQTKRQYLRVLAFVVLCICAGVLFWLFLSNSSRQPIILFAPKDIPVNTEDATAPEATSTLAASPSEPRTLHIPSINLTVPFEAPLGIDTQGAVEVPKAYDTVGWYKYGPTPGELGPAVIFGHVDNYKGPAVFFSLGQVSTGDPVVIERTDGSKVTFEITGYERVEQEEFPMERVYGNLPYAGIRLVTCTGIYDRSTLRYSHNLIVYGKLITIEHASGTATTSADL